MKLLALLTAWVWKGVDLIQLLTTPALLGSVVILGLVIGVPWAVENRRWKKSLDAVRKEERQTVKVDPVLDLTGHRRKWGFFRREPMMAQLSPEGFEVERKDHILEGKWAEVTSWERSGFADWTLYFGDEKHDMSLTRRDGFSKSERKAFDRRMALYTENVRELGGAEALRMWVRRTRRTWRQSLPRKRGSDGRIERSMEPVE